MVNKILLVSHLHPCKNPSSIRRHRRATRYGRPLAYISPGESYLRCVRTWNLWGQCAHEPDVFIFYIVP